MDTAVKSLMASPLNTHSSGYPQGYDHSGYGTSSGCRRRGTSHSPDNQDDQDVFPNNDYDYDNDRGRKPSMPSLPLPVYNRFQDWNVFEHLLLDEFNRCEVPNHHRITYLKRLVPDDGLSVLMDPTIRTFNEALDELRKLYSPIFTDRDVHTEFLNIKQRDNEPFRSLAARISSFIRLHPDHYRNWTPMGQRSLILDQFIESIADPDIRKSVYDRTPLSIEDAVEFAERKQRYLTKHPNKGVRFAHGNYSPHRSPSPGSSNDSSAMKEVLQKLSNLESKIATLEKAQRRSMKQRSMDKVQCYWCLGFGHFQNKCQAKRNGEPKANRQSSNYLNSNNQD